MKKQFFIVLLFSRLSFPVKKNTSKLAPECEGEC